jgi:hypothetical protein
MPTFHYYNWEEVNINWENVNMKWEEVGFLISEVLPLTGSGPLGAGPGKKDLERLNKLSREKKRKIIKIVCKIKGEDDEYISYKYKNDDIKITAEHINIILNELLKNKIEVNVQDIS